MKVTPEVIAEIRNRFRYEEGVLKIKKSGQWRGKVGEEPGSMRPDGRRLIKIFRKGFLYHQVVWLMFNDSLPKGTIDHKDRNPANNRIENLRESNDSQQGMNRNIQSNNTSGYKGVSFRSDIKKKPWKAYIGLDNKTYHIGYYATAIEAARAYDERARELFGEYANLNF